MEKKKRSDGIKRKLINLLLTLALALVYLYATLPAINPQDPEFYSYVFIVSAFYCLLSVIGSGIALPRTAPPDLRLLWQEVKRTCAIPLFLCLGLVALYLTGSLLSSPIIRAASYSNLLTVGTGDFISEVDEISFDQIPMLDDASARRLGDRKLGELADMVSQFEVANDYTQINYKGRPVRVTPLVYGDVIKWLNNRSDGLPAYIIIDMVTQNVEVVRISDIMADEGGIRYTTAERFFRYLPRYLRMRYPTFIFDAYNFEIDDNGVPYWVCPRIVKRIGLFGGRDIQGAVLVNAVTGESEYYEDPPEWVDRVYMSALIIEQYDYHGMYENGFFNSLFGQRGVTVTTDGYNYMAINDDVYMYTGITSVGADESNTGFILTNQRTKDTRFYSIAGAEEFSAMSSAQGAVQDMKYVATFPLLLNISSQPTYFMALKDSAGLVKMYAMVNVQQYQIVATGTNVAECEANYRTALSENNLSELSEIAAVTVTGRIDDIRMAVIDGNTFVYIKLEIGDCYYRIKAAGNELAVILSPGDRVTLETDESSSELRLAYSIERAS